MSVSSKVATLTCLCGALIPLVDSSDLRIQSEKSRWYTSCKCGRSWAAWTMTNGRAPAPPLEDDPDSLDAARGVMDDLLVAIETWLDWDGTALRLREAMQQAHEFLAADSAYPDEE